MVFRRIVVNGTVTDAVVDIDGTCSVWSLKICAELISYAVYEISPATPLLAHSSVVDRQLRWSFQEPSRYVCSFAVVNAVLAASITVDCFGLVNFPQNLG